LAANPDPDRGGPTAPKHPRTNGTFATAGVGEFVPGVTTGAAVRAVSSELYWLTGTAASAARLYYENAHATPPHEPTTVPIGLAAFGATSAASAGSAGLLAGTIVNR
jgi:hypothetical protein